MTELVVPPRVADRLARTCEVPFALFAPPSALADGEVVRLHAAGPLGLAVIDRTAARFRVLADGEASAHDLDRAWAVARLSVAQAHRAAVGLAGAGRAYRLLNGAGDRTPGLTADVYGNWLVVSAQAPALHAPARLLGEAWVADAPGRGAVLKARGRGQAADGPAVLGLVGEPPPDRLVVAEGAWRFEVHLTTGVNVGLFTDMRDERRRLRDLAAGRRVLNLFAYTGALSVAMAAGGATEVTSVDLSKGALAWARDHFVLNALESVVHHTVADDVGTFVGDAAARHERFDLVVVDPPSYSAARGAPFAIDRDYPALLAALMPLVAPGGYLWAASNTRGFALLGALQHAVVAARRRGVWVSGGGLPADYPTELADLDARYLQTVVLRLL